MIQVVDSSSFVSHSTRSLRRDVYAEMIKSALPFVGRDRQRVRARRVKAFVVTMLYIAMLVLLAFSRGFTIGHPSPDVGASTATNLAGRQRDHSLDEEAASVRRRSEIKSGTSPQKVLSILRQTRASMHLYGREEASNRRLLQAGPGSSLPSCSGKCGVCSPCKPVHVTIGSPHEVISETEYYPEVWRCQCGKKLFIP